MSTPLTTIEGFFEEKGNLSKLLRDFEFRPSQLEMARVISKALKQGVPAIVEAGTGTGKTMGYLVPAIMSGKKSIISTGTKNLQEQIYFKDIPLISKAMGIPVDSTLMKGRKNYLCLYRYNQYFSHRSFLDPGRERNHDEIERWLKKTEFADRAELQWLSDDDPLWDSISSASDQCLGSDCMYMEDCYLNAIRKKAAISDVIIVNHHLYFADLMVKKGGFGEIIPRAQVTIFDEAHKVEEIATSYFGDTLGTGQLIDLVREMEKNKEKLTERDRKKITISLNYILAGIERLRELFNDFPDKGRLEKEVLSGINEGPCREIIRGLNDIKHSGEMDDPDIRNRAGKALAERAGELAHSMEVIFSLDDPNWLNWFEKRKTGIVFHASPLDISMNMEELLYSKVKRIIFTSATLSTNGSFGYMRSRMGIPEEAVEGIFASDFEYSHQTLMYIPKDLPPPTSREFGIKAASRIKAILEITSGRALILFTSYLNLNMVYGEIEGKMPFPIYKQGEAPRNVLLEKFKEDTSSVLMATGSFWEGVDVPGEALSCLIIDKLPFDSPGDPLVAARIESMRSRGENPFMDYQLPSAIIALKQGLGRLIRKRSDRGILSILDKRIITSGYGRYFLNSLPEMPISHDLEAIRAFFPNKEEF